MSTTIKPWIVAGCGLFAAVMLLWPPPFLTLSASQAGAFVLVVLSLWATGLVAEYLTALIFFSGAMLLGLAPPEVVFSGFSSGAFWLILGGLVLGVAINVTGLGQRLASLVTGRLSSSYGQLIGGLVLAGTLFALLMPSALGRVVLLVPIGVFIAEQSGLVKGSKGYTGIVAAVLLGSFLPGFTILPANVPNMVMAGLGETLFGYTPLYGEYLLLHFPVLGVGKMLLLWAVILFLFPDQLRTDHASGGSGAGPMGRQEKILAVILAGLLLLWITDVYHHISPAWVAMAGACLVLLPVTGVVSNQLFQQKINFGSLFYISGILGLGQVINHTGLGAGMAGQFIELLPLSAGADFSNYMWLGSLSLFLGALTTQPGIPAVLTPFAQELAAVTGLDVKAVLMTQVLGFSQPLFVYQVPPLLIGLQIAGVPLAQGFRLCVLLVAGSLLLLFPLDFLWWRLLGWL